MIGVSGVFGATQPEPETIVAQPETTPAATVDAASALNECLAACTQLQRHVRILAWALVAVVTVLLIKDLK